MQETLFPIDSQPLFRLHQHQRQALSAIMQGLSEPGSTGLYVAATGCGKTEVAAAAMERHAKAVMVVPYIDLCDQTARRLRSRGLTVGIERAQLTSSEPYTVASYCTLLKHGRADHLIGNTDLLVIDEVHINYTSKSLALISKFREAGARILGMTATPERKGDPLLKFYGNLLYHYPIEAAEKDGYLVPCRTWLTVIDDLDFSNFRSTYSDFDEVLLGKLMSKARVVEAVAELVAQHYEGRSSVVFTASIDQAEAVCQALASRGIASVPVHSDENRLSKDERRRNLSLFESGEVKVIVNVGCLCLGWDCPMVQCVFVARPTLNGPRYRQMYGRGTRPLPGVIDGLATPEQRRAAIAESGKPFFELFDITDSSRHNSVKSCIGLWLPDEDEKVIARVRERAPRGCTREEVDEIAAAERAALKAEEQAQLELLQKQRQAQARGSYRSFGVDHYGNPELAQRPRGWHMLFGKYRGWPLSKVPSDYLRWLVNSSNCKNEAFMAAIRRELKKRAA